MSIIDDAIFKTQDLLQNEQYLYFVENMWLYDLVTQSGCPFQKNTLSLTMLLRNG